MSTPAADPAGPDRPSAADPGPARVIRVVVVDDELLVRSGISAILSSAADLRVVAAVSGGEALAVVQRWRADVVLLDIRMPDVDGLTVLAQLRRLAQPPAVSMLTTFSADAHVATALSLGAEGYLLKDTDPLQLIDHVRALADGASVLSPAVTSGVISGFLRSHHDEEARRALQCLTAREHDVLGLLAAGAANADIAASLHLSVPTIKEHISAIFAKLGVGNRVQAALLASRAGLAPGDPQRPGGT